MEDRRRPSSRITDDYEDLPTERKSPGKEKGQRESIAATAENVAERAKEFLTWTFTDVFDWNPRYLKSVRGILNICEVALSMLVMALVASACQMQPWVDSRSFGFYCKSSDTFLFMVSSSAFLSSFLMLVCCMLSKKTESRMLSTSYEVSFYIFYSVLYFLSAVALTSSVINRNRGKYSPEESYNNTLAGGIFGIVNFIIYGFSATWFFIYHRNKKRQENSETDEVVEPREFAT
ncbi:MARVEL domain-containing protein [Caerostris darwini]|uniref:MARVEL domain-containing protein n=1 Tax=Caerostris darwini TaxID=1538125 RepID=A0AAV4UXM5_9ARAC|nr:MARVEL domain-containing protein [Caerostris darwini]